MSKFSCILLVEDDHISSFISMKAMKLFNPDQDINLHTDGRDALKFLEEIAQSGGPAPELILFDLALPGLSGKKFYNQVKLLPFVNKEKVILCVLTNSEDVEDADYLKEQGVHEYISKPLTKNILESIYNKYFGSK